MNNGTRIGVTEKEPLANPEITAREQDVERAGEAFSVCIQEASEASRATVERAVSVVRPVLIGVGILAGTLLTVQLLRGSRRAQVFRILSTPPRRTLWSELARAAVIAVASTTGRRLAERWIEQQAVVASAPSEAQR